uniref:Ovule protein n=1 Tax=Caenorhabditis tropicalis TaxID=1561998 RepID=A0A1I7TZ44_9PELO
MYSVFQLDCSRKRFVVSRLARLMIPDDALLQMGKINERASGGFKEHEEGDTIEKEMDHMVETNGGRNMTTINGNLRNTYTKWRGTV